MDASCRPKATTQESANFLRFFPYFLRAGGGGVKSYFSAIFSLCFRKLEKAVAVSGVCSGVLRENSGKVPGKLLEHFSRIAKCYKF